MSQPVMKPDLKRTSYICSDQVLTAILSDFLMAVTRILFIYCIASEYQQRNNEEHFENKQNTK